MMINREQSSSWSSYNYKSCQRTTILWSFGLWTKLERWKSSITGCLMRWPKNFKKLVILKCCLLFYRTIANCFSDYGMRWKADFIQQSVMTRSVVGPKRSSKALPKAKLDQKLRLYSLVFCCPSDPLQLSKSKQNHYIWEVYSANQWNAPKTAMPVPALVNRKGPVLLHDNA